MTSLPRPAIVMWEVTRACKLSCAHCVVGPQEQRSAAELSTYEAYKTIDQIVALRPQELIMTGGDPLERSDLYQLIDYAVRRGANPTLTLSPTPLLTGSVMGKLRHHGLTRIAIAIDAASPAPHDALRGLFGQFAAMLTAVRWARTAELEIEANTLVTTANLNDLPAMARLLTSLGIQRWNVYFPVPLRGAKSVASLKPEEVERAFEQLLKIGGEVAFGIRTFEAPMLEDDIVFISHSGEVASSPFAGVRAGNVRYQPLSAIYSSADLFASNRRDISRH
ncbi:MAG TPA: radical SAM protein [Thermoanaerobaculia bacterium]|nr:radical SAM protein [Thermoanaerobaculia bacterium]